MSKVEKYIGEAKISEQPTKKLTWMINDNVVATNHIKDNAVTEPKISGEDSPNGPAVTTAKIADKAVTTSKIADRAVTEDKISGGLIDGVMTQPAVTTAKIADNAVTSDKLSDINDPRGAAVTAGKIQDGAVTAEKLAAKSVIEGNIAERAVHHENLAPESVTGFNIAEKAIDGSNLKDKTIAGINIKDGTIGTDQLSGGLYDGVMTPPCITTEKIADWQPDSEYETGVTTEKIADYAVTEAKLANGAITTEKLATPVIEKLQTIMDAEPTAGSVLPVQSGGVEGAINDVEQVMFNTDTQKWVYSRTLPVPTATSTYFLHYLGKCNCKITIECSETTVNMALRGVNKETGNSINLLAFEERSFPLTINNPRPELELINLFVLTASNAPACTFTVTIEKDNPFVGLHGELDVLEASMNQKTTALATTEKEDKDNLDESYFNIDTQDIWIKKKFDIVPGNRYDILKYLGKTACTFTVEGSVSPAKIWMAAENIATGNTITLWGSNSGTVELPATFTNPRPDLELENLRIHTNGTGTRDTITVKVSKQSPIVALNNAVEAVEGEVDGIKYLVGDWSYEKIHYGVNDVTWETGAVRGGTGADSATSAAMKRTNFINVEGLEEIEFLGQIAYQAGQTYGYSFYSDDDASAFVSGSAFNIDTTLSAVTPKVYKVAVPAGAKYFRTCRTVAAVGDDWYLESVLGTTITDEIDAIEDAIDEINKESEFCNGVLNTFKSNFDGWYECQETEFDEGFSTWNEDNYQYPPTYATLIGLYDGFMADNAGRMTKYELGNGSGTDAGGNVYKLYEYRIVPKVVTHSLNKTVTPRVLIDATMHGHERNAAFALYYFIKDLLYNYDKSPILEYIRTFVEIRFIPISNPWGFEHNQYVNANGVNLNRNFPTDGWQVVTTPADQATGAEPLNQPESIILDNWLKANKDEMLMHLNLHTNGARTVSVDYANSNCLMPFEYDDVYYDRLFSAIQRHIQYQTLKFSEEYDNINPGYSQVIGRYQTGTPTTGTRGNIDEYGVTKLNIISMTFEMFGGIKDSNNDPIVVGGSTQSQKMCTEMLGNFIARVLQEYSE